MSERIVSGQLPADTNEQFERYCENNDLSKSEAVRRFVEDGLDETRRQGHRSTRDLISQMPPFGKLVVGAFVLASIFSLFLGLTATAGVLILNSPFAGVVLGGPTWIANVQVATMFLLASVASQGCAVITSYAAYYIRDYVGWEE
jgi:hypothetical protein